MPRSKGNSKPVAASLMLLISGDPIQKNMQKNVFMNNYLYNIIMNERMMWKKIQKNERIIIQK